MRRVEPYLPLVRHPGSAVSIVLTDGSVVVVRQRRASVDATTTELPQEKLEPDEMPMEAAQRGLSEECGLTARNWRPCGEFWAVPAYSTHRVYVFVAEFPEPVKNSGSRKEPIDVDQLPLREADRHVDDAISLAALQLYHRRLKRDQVPD